MIIVNCIVLQGKEKEGLSFLLDFCSFYFFLYKKEIMKK